MAKKPLPDKLDAPGGRDEDLLSKDGIEEALLQPRLNTVTAQATRGYQGCGHLQRALHRVCRVEHGFLVFLKIAVVC